MTAPLIHDLAPLRLGTTVLAVDDLQRSPNIASRPFQHSGNLYGSVMPVAGAAPRARFKTPFAAAYALLGLTMVQFTACDLYLAKFVSGLRSTTTARKLALAASCSVAAYIRSLSVSERGVLMAEVEVVYLSSDGMTFPVTPSDGNTIPVLGSEPVLHTMGPSSIGGTVFAGAQGISVDLGSNIVDGIDGNPGDGLLYPTVCQFLGAAPTITVEHGDPTTVEDLTGQVGAAISTAFVQYFRQYDTTTQLSSATGMSLTVASGRVMPTDNTAPAQRVARGGFRVETLSATATHPIAVAASVSVPTP